MANKNIQFTFTDEAPALTTYSFVKILRAFLKQANIQIEVKDISLAGRILSQFSNYLSSNQQFPDHLAELGKLVKHPEANIIKLPNISASIPQLQACIKELQQKGLSLPNYPENPTSTEEEKIKALYDKVKGSAVNPVLREGNSDRRVPKAVKNFAKKNPHFMGEWSKDSSSHVASMSENDFYGNEKSTTMTKNTTASIVVNGKVFKSLPLLSGEVIDCSVMNMSTLESFITGQIADAKAKGVIFSLHLKATMMKVSDPIIFGAVVRVFYKKLFTKYADLFNQLGIHSNNGIGDVYTKISGHPQEQEILNTIEEIYKQSPNLAMVNSDKGITNLHVPSDIIIDASMPAMIRNSGQMWNSKAQSQDTKAVIPDRSYASVYQATIDFCKENGAFDPTTMGSVSNIGLMAQKAQEYGSHDKTFQLENDATIQIIDSEGTVLLEQKAQKGDIFRMCQVKDIPIQNWVGLAVERAKITKTPAVFWLDKNRTHDYQIIQKVEKYLSQYDTNDLEILILSPLEATRYSLQRIKQGLDTISVTGNVLRDYLTDLFPILEVGTSAKMLSIVPLLNGGGVFETGAGGSAPKHVEQFINENYLRWDSLGEFLAIIASLEHYSKVHDNSKALVFSQALDKATIKFLDKNKSPARKVGFIDNRGSQFYLSLYWAEFLAKQDEDRSIKKIFTKFYNQLLGNEQVINQELLDEQGKKVELKGYFKPDFDLTTQAMCPSVTFNSIIESFI